MKPIILILFSLFSFNLSIVINQAKIDEIDKVIEQRMKSARLNKFGIVIANSTKIIHQKVFGEGITTKTPFTIASVTKSFTALSILKLNISLNQTIDAFHLEDYIDNDLAKKITVRDLLSHSSGLDGASPKQVGKKGEFLYSNYNYGLLGKIIAKMSEEKNYGDFVKKHIFDEISMNNSGTDFIEDIMDSYDNFFGSLSRYTGLESDYKRNDGFDIPAGYIRSTIEDMGKYIQSYLNETHKNYIQQMGEPITKIDYNLYYGMGIFIRNKNGKPIYDHSGIFNHFLTHLYVYPDDDLAYFFFTNTNDAFCSGPFYRFLAFLETLIVDDVKAYEQTFTSIDGLDFFLSHFAMDTILLIIIAIPLTYLIITVIRKIKKKKPMWFDGVKGKIIFGVDVFLLIILPIILLIALVEAFKSTKDFIFTLLTSTIIMMVTFVVKLVYFFLFRKYWKDIEFYDDKKDKNQELFNLNDE